MPLFNILAPILDKALSFIPNPVERAKAVQEHAAAIEAALAANDLAQLKVNEVEANNASLFVSGWRPFCGWVCASGLAWTFVLQPLLDWVLNIFYPQLTTPMLDGSQLMTLLFGMLGMGAMRSYEKIQGVSK